ncbi:phage recombination protein Bet [Clostridium tagluense]|uniref:phage recombination protein Bet n=1 Tax=Clostridium tagluense TaxID=360422 RepID=UPI001CF3C42B|nr:phage recombination protein Bet [Clostridium tagluense]MCB2310679.1 phage recombination protein Bet [Clostridium tagluense]MCB2315591.1 phage recombination protein Bet [Clostridium tagluense]MCB2320445.1 phage recombination protein Bet [Clostridium tagluense]MCB2325272.1 phage recombination protein Bet [Clostridium tagluense]MCB2330124.1 phage recombination protein Bet [Clostridium tagluense]
MSEKSSAVTLLEKEIVYTVGEEEVRLTANIVKTFIAKGNKTVTDRELVVFMNLCKYRKLNPFLNEAYLVKFGDEAQMVVGKEALMRKAEESPRYKGHKAGIIVAREKEILELEGCFKLQTDVLVGGWAEIFVEGKDYPIVAKVALAEYSKGQSTWKSMPSTMIRKVALVQALRESFPSEIGALYSKEELGIDEDKIINIKQEIKDEIKNEANKDFVDIPVDVPTDIKEDKVPIIDAEIVTEKGEDDAPY